MGIIEEELLGESTGVTSEYARIAEEAMQDSYAAENAKELSVYSALNSDLWNEDEKKRRDANDIANGGQPLFFTDQSGPLLLSDTKSVNLKDIEDNRLFNPEGSARQERTIQGSGARIIPRTLPESPGNKRTPFGMFYFYRDSTRVIECLRRHTRRELMFATGNAGKYKKKKPPKFDRKSMIRCDDLDLGHIM